MTNIVRKAALAVTTAGAAAGSSLALAATATPIDTALVTAQLSEIETGLMAVGGVLIALAAVAVGFNWIKGMIFG